ILPLLFSASGLPEIYALSLHDALPILADCAASRSGKRNSNRCRPRLRPASRLCWERGVAGRAEPGLSRFLFGGWSRRARNRERRSEEHTSELQSRGHLVCRLLLETKKE